MTAAMLCGIAGVEQKTLENSAAYLRKWIARLKSYSRLLVSAASQAQKAADFIHGKVAHQDAEDAGHAEDRRRRQQIAQGQAPRPLERVAVDRNRLAHLTTVSRLCIWSWSRPQYSRQRIL